MIQENEAVESLADNEVVRENLQNDFKLENSAEDEKSGNNKTLKRFLSNESHGSSYGEDVVEDLDDAFAYHGGAESSTLNDDHDMEEEKIEHKDSESPVTISENTRANKGSEEPKHKEARAVDANSEHPATDNTDVEIVDSTDATEAAELLSPAVRTGKPVRISEAKLYAKLNEKDKEPSTPVVIDTGLKKENSVRTVARTIDKGFSMRTPDNPGESTDDIKNWIKSTMSGKKFQRKDIVTASRDSFDEDSGEMKRRSWSFKKTPETTPDKTDKRPKSQSITPTSSAKIKSAMKETSRDDSNSDTSSTKKHSASKLRFADRPLPSPRSEYGFGEESARSAEESMAALNSPNTFRKASFNFDSTPTTPSTSFRSSAASDASNEDNDEGEADTPIRRLRKIDSERVRSKLETASAKEAYDRSKLRTVQIERKETKKQVEEDDEPVAVVVEEKKPLVIVYHPIKYLQECNLKKQFDGLCLGTLEAHLTDDDFKKYFGVKREDYYQQPQWKQHDRKKRLGLF